MDSDGVVGRYTSIALDTSGNSHISYYDGTNADLNLKYSTNSLSACTYSISPASQSFSSDGGTNSVSVTAPTGCDWTGTSNASWITIDSGNSGSGNGTVNYSVATYTGTSLRTGTMTIAEKTFTVTQEGTCSYSITPTSQSFSSDGGINSVSVTTASGCSWTATSNASWLTITSGISGSANGIVNYSVSVNTSAGSRTGTMTIAGKTFTVGQAGVGASPAPDIKTNGSDVPIMLERSNPLLVSINLAAGGSLGIDGDWWAAAYTPFGWYYFDDGTMNWTYAGVSYTDLSPTYQGPLFDLGTFEILSMSGLPVGTYTFYFAVDTNMNGSLDFDQLYSDSVVVNITP